MNDRIYFIAESGPVLEAIAKATKIATERFDRNQKFQKEMNAVGIWKSNKGPVTGLLYPEDAETPAGLRKKEAEIVEGEYLKVMVPRRGSKEGKKLSQHPAFNEDVWELKEFHNLTGRYMTMHSAPGGGLMLASPSFETIGGKVVVNIPTTDEPYDPPEGLIPLKMSEYWALKEAAAA